MSRAAERQDNTWHGRVGSIPLLGGSGATLDHVTVSAHVRESRVLADEATDLQEGPVRQFLPPCGLAARRANPPERPRPEVACGLSCTFALLVLLGLASPLQAQTPTSDQTGRRLFVEGGVGTGGFGPEDLFHAVGASGEVGVLIRQGPVRNAPTVTRSVSLRARVDTLSGNGYDDWFVSLLVGLASQLNRRVALEATVGYETYRGRLHGATAGVGVPLFLGNRTAIVPRLGVALLMGGEDSFGLGAQAHASLNLRLKL